MRRLVFRKAKRAKHKPVTRVKMYITKGDTVEWTRALPSKEQHSFLTGWEYPIRPGGYLNTRIRCPAECSSGL